MARSRFVVAGAGVVGASIAYHLALRGADGVVLADTETIASGATGKALGGVRQQFSSAPEVRLARESVGFFRSLGPDLFEPVGYLFLATTEDGLDELERRREVQASLGVPVERVDAARVEGLMTDDVLGAVFCGEDGTADPAGITRELVRRAAELGVDVRERTDALELDADVLVLATGASSAPLARKLGVELPIRPLVRQLVETARVPGLARELPLTIESESGFHFRRRGEALVLAMPESTPRWGDEQVVDEALVTDWVERIARRFPRPGLGRALRHDPRRASHRRGGRRRALRRVRVLRPRVHAGPGGGADRRRRASRDGPLLRPFPVPPRTLRRRGGVPGDGHPVAPTLAGY